MAAIDAISYEGVAQQVAKLRIELSPNLGFGIEKLIKGAALENMRLQKGAYSSVRITLTREGRRRSNGNRKGSHKLTSSDRHDVVQISSVNEGVSYAIDGPCPETISK